MPRNSSTQYLIEVLEGPASGASIPLVGRQLPFRAGAGGSISYGRTQRSKLTWYPGNKTASQQIIGPILKPTTINGVWQDRYLGTDAAIDLVEMFEELLTTGVQVRVSWSTIVRQGIVKEVDFQPGNPTGGLGDIAWTITFEWNAEGQPPIRTINAGQPSLRDGLIDAANAIGTLGQAIGIFIQSVGDFLGSAVSAFQATETALGNLQSGFAQPLTTVSTSAAQMASEASLPSRLVEDTSAAVGSAQTNAGTTGDTVGNVFQGLSTVSDTIETLLTEALLRYDILDQVFTTLFKLQLQREMLEGIVRPPAFTRVPALFGQDLRSFAVQFYGQADLWPRIAQANGIETSVIPTDIAELIVPLGLPDATDPSMGGTGDSTPGPTSSEGIQGS